MTIYASAFTLWWSDQSNLHNQHMSAIIPFVTNRWWWCHLAQCIVKSRKGRRAEGNITTVVFHCKTVLPGGPILFFFFFFFFFAQLYFVLSISIAYCDNNKPQTTFPCTFVAFYSLLYLFFLSTWKVICTYGLGNNSFTLINILWNKPIGDSSSCVQTTVSSFCSTAEALVSARVTRFSSSGCRDYRNICISSSVE